MRIKNRKVEVRLGAELKDLRGREALQLVTCPACNARRYVRQVGVHFCAECGLPFQHGRQEDDPQLIALSEKIGRPVLGDEGKLFNHALTLLEKGRFLDFACEIVSDFHAGDVDAVRLLLISVLRIGFSAPSVGLLHYKIGGLSGVGKSDLLNTVLALLPVRRVRMFNSVSAKVLYYASVDATGKSNPKYYTGTVVAVQEANESGTSAGRGYDAIKAIGEQSEAEVVHSVTMGLKARELKIGGPRCLLLSAVTALRDQQAANRLISLDLKPETEGARIAKARMQAANGMNGTSIETDLRRPIAQAGFELLFSDPTPFTEPSDEVRARVTELSEHIALNATGTTRRVRQYVALVFCEAALETFARGERRLELADVEAAYELITPWL